jgi:WhiB family redox-sensing transcriptional regulator
VVRVGRREAPAVGGDAPLWCWRPAAVRAEEWSDDLGGIPGSLTKLTYSLGQFVAGLAVAPRRKIKNASLGRTSNPAVAIDSRPYPAGAVDVGWQDRARCSQIDPEAFFPEKGGSTRDAKKVCQGCEVRAECLQFAIDHDERFGVWGGLSERERRRLKDGALIT